MFRKGHVDIAEMVNYLTVDFLRNALVKTPVSSFKMENGNFPSFCRNDCQAAIGVAVKQDCIRLFLLQDRIHPADHQGDCLRRIAATRLKEVIGTADFQVGEEHFVQFVIIILACMDNNDLMKLLNLLQDTAHLDDFRSRSDYCHYLHKFGSLKI